MPKKNEINALLSSDEESVEIVSKKPQLKKKAVASDSDESSDDVNMLKNKKKAVPQTKAPVKKTKVQSSDDESSEEVVKKPVKKQVKAADSDEESDDVPKKSALPKAQPKKIKEPSSDEESDDVPVKKAPAKKKADSDSDESSDEVPVKKTNGAQKKPVVESSEEDDDEEEVVKKPVQNKVQEEEEEEEGHSEIFVKNLSWSTNENSLRKFFSNYGAINNVKLLMNRETGKSRGLAFVEFSKRSEAQAVINDEANLSIDGRNVQVSFSNEKDTRPVGNNNRQGGFNQGGYNQGGNQGGYQQRSNYSGDRHTIFVGNLGFKTREDTVRKFFSDCGNVVDVRIAKNEEGRSKGFCHVDFDSSDAVESAKAKAGQDLDGREVRVDASTPRQGGGSGGRGGFGGRGGRGGFRGGRGGSQSFDPLQKAKKSGGIISGGGSRVTFEDSD